LSTDARKAFATLLNFMVQAVVDHTDSVRININQGPQTTCYEIHVAKSDVGKVLGKEGSMVRSFRKILVAFAAKHKFRGVIEVVE